MTDSTTRSSQLRTRLLSGVTSIVLVATGVAFAAPSRAAVQCNPGAWSGNNGDGTSAATAYEISSVDDLKNIEDSGCDDDMVYYVLTNDINLINETAWEPIGDSNFSGNFDGQGFTIQNLQVDDNNGLFDTIYKIEDEADSAVVKNLNITGENYSPNWNDYVGGLAGYADGATISNVHSAVDVTADTEAGGLLGYADYENGQGTSIINSSASGDVTANGNETWSDIGGLVGYADYQTNIVNSHATGDVNTVSSNQADGVGGLVGYSYYAQIVNSSSSGSVTTDEGDDVGGLVGDANYTSIDGSSSSSTVSADVSDSYNVGGLVGYWYNSDYSGTMTNVEWTGTKVKGYEAVGGLVGYFDSDGYNGGIIGGFSSGKVEGINGDIGGAVGFADYGQFVDISVTGSVEGDETDAYSVGGVIGDANYAQIHNASVVADVSGQGEVGGIVGDSYETYTSNVAVTGDVTGSEYEIGGIIGYSEYDRVTNASYNGDVLSEDDGYVGGIVGETYYSDFAHVSSEGTVTMNCIGSDSYAGGAAGYMDESNLTYARTSSDVIASCPGTDDAYDVGGLVGYFDYGTISNSAATGDVTSDGGTVGGLVGNVGQETHINNSYSRGTVTGEEDGIGGLIGEFDYDAEDLSVVNSYTTSTVVDASLPADRDIDAFGSHSDAYFVDNTGTNFFLKGDYTTSVTDAKGLTSAELQDAAGLSAAGWKIAADGAWSKSNTWALHSTVNDGFPYLTGLDAAATPVVNPDTCAPASLTTIAFTGNSSKLTKAAKATLNANAGAIKASLCSTVNVKSYKGASKKSKAVAAKRIAVVQ
ncbi:MAG: hypothetical protein F2839_00345, partial [Actinobacteria bacterium]|nr:hypothetical protein [Actinomycetota bacterium]